MDVDGLVEALHEEFGFRKREVLIQVLKENAYNLDDARSQLRKDRENARIKRRKIVSEDNAIKAEATVIESSDSEQEYDENEMGIQEKMLAFFNETEAETIPRLSSKDKKNLLSKRPFSSWDELNEMITALPRGQQCIEACHDIVEEDQAIRSVLDASNKVSSKMMKLFDIKDPTLQTFNLSTSKQLVSSMTTVEQPSCLRGTLKDYQLVGLTWLSKLDHVDVNAILADEMGLGKTVQAIAFLAFQLQLGDIGPHCVFVPPSTRDNWVREFEKWCPELSLLEYQGSQEDRAFIRRDIIKSKVKYNVLLTTYSVCSSHADDRQFFRKMKFHTVIFDEGHMMKNMKAQRYKELNRIKAKRRLLLTGTPLQNNLLELMSLLNFTCPNLFSKYDAILRVFTKRKGQINSEDELVSQARQIMAPFVLRRTKNEVLQQLPKKSQQIITCPMTEIQETLYRKLESESSDLSTNLKDFDDSVDEKDMGEKLQNTLMQLRKAANHPLLHRRLYTTEKLKAMSKAILRDPNYSDCDYHAVLEDMTYMNDFELWKLCESSSALKEFLLKDDELFHSTKVLKLQKILSERPKDDRYLIFSQFTAILDILERVLKLMDLEFLRLDGSTPVADRQFLIDEYTNNKEIKVFLLSTKAGGLGINLTAANVVIIHDIDFNPYNDKQAEDRCHRVGQTKPVDIIRLVTEKSVEESMLEKAKIKLELGKEISS